MWAAGRKPERGPSSGGTEDRDKGGAHRGRGGGGEEQREQAPGRERREGPGRRARRRPVPGRLRDFLGEKTGSAPLFLPRDAEVPRAWSGPRNARFCLAPGEFWCPFREVLKRP